ncbi:MULTISPECIES: LytR C-terminal domain-containing protein [Actinosynnema]|uniref:LytR C-terminal domain-containing protein n=1 Tax=Actinosynnema TaxID=40566 RepID=UPI0020A25725|nr:LytR C-terminal domain-containing protein [Actinosynnema pretiosum]MCP2096790.1 LytR cell envelope-related transcriptional attenuator [Actinosynnema pretiosum]
MSNPESSGSAQPARAAGFALLGLAGVALVLGVVTLFTGSDDDPQAQQQQPTPTASAPADPGASGEPPAGEPSASEPATESSAPPATTTTAEQPPATTTEQQQPQPQPQPPAQQPGDQSQGTPATRPSVRVYNNSNISGLAARASDDIGKSGWAVQATGNYPDGIIETTTVYYRAGTAEEDSAKQLAQSIRARVMPRFDGIKDAHDGVIVIVTNDYQGPSGKVGS